MIWNTGAEGLCSAFQGCKCHDPRHTLTDNNMAGRFQGWWLCPSSPGGVSLSDTGSGQVASQGPTRQAWQRRRLVP